MTVLGDLLARQIAKTGPITVAEFMASCLGHPEHGYYMRRDPLGAGGDFMTAPEISQMFGELIGLSLAQSWQDQGAPAPVTLAELGPGRGSLMADILRATRSVPGFHEAITLHLVETSHALRAEQARRLADHAPTWLDRAEELPDAPLFLVANEFFDALPVRQFVRDGDGWRERVIGLSDGRLAFGLTGPVPQPALGHRLQDTRDGDLVETCAPATAIAADIGARLVRHGGAALIVDYGGWTALGDTLQAVRDHAGTDPLEAPGQADLTAHVDFAALAQAARPAAHAGPTPQGVFLERLGITPRARRLAQALSGPELDAHVAAHRRLTHPGEMGSLFTVLALYPEGAAPPPGTEP